MSTVTVKHRLKIRWMDVLGFVLMMSFFTGVFVAFTNTF